MAQHIQRPWLSFLLMALVGTAAAIDINAAEIQSKELLANLKNERGICVLLGEKTADLAFELARQSDLTIYLQSTNSQGRARDT